MMLAPPPLWYAAKARQKVGESRSAVSTSRARQADAGAERTSGSSTSSSMVSGREFEFVKSSNGSDTPSYPPGAKGAPLKMCLKFGLTPKLLARIDQYL